MKKITSVVLLLFTGIFSVKAQFVYPNDNCSGALLLSVGNTGQLNDSVYQRNDYADPATSAIPNCTGSTTNLKYDLWYRFIAPDTTIAVIPEFLSSNGFNYQVFSGTCGALSSIACNSSPVVYPPVTGLVPGQQYYLRTFYYGSLASPGAASNYKLSLLSKPVNDECTAAALLQVAPPGSQAYRVNRFSTELATASGSACVNTSGWAGLKDVWYKFTANSTVHTVYIESLTSGSKAICYSGTPGNLVPLPGAAFTAGVSVVTSVMQLNSLTIGQSYYIRVGATASIKFNLSVTGGAPANDECINADTVVMNTAFNCENRFFVNRLNATSGAGPCNMMDKDVWFIFKATAASVNIKAAGDGAASLRLGLMSGACGALSCLANGTGGTLNYTGLTIGNYYYLNAAGSSGAETMASLCISPKITNDDCSNAIALSVQPYGKLKSYIGSNAGATQSLPACGSGSVVKDVWYKFTAIDTGCVITIDGDANSPKFEVFSGNCTSLNSIYCSNSALPGTSAKIGGLITGNEYYVRYYGSSGEGLLSIDINRLPVNNECSGAAVLIPQEGLQYKNLLNNGINDATESLAPCTITSSTKDIWYQFTATHTSTAIISNREAAVPGEVIGFQVYSGGCSSLNSIACFSQSSVVRHQAFTATGLVPGQTYYLRQYGNFSSNSISIVNPPVNDNISGAIQLTPTPVGIQTGSSYYLHGASRQFEKICNTVTTLVQHDVWFYFIPSAVSHTVSTNNNNSFWDEELTGYSYRIEAFRGYAADSVSLAGKLLSCATNTLTLNGLTPGDTVYLRVAGTGSAGNTSIFGINVSNTQNIDDPAGALLLTKTDSYQYKLGTSGATQSLPASGCLIADFPDDDVWFRFTAAPGIKRVIAAFETADITIQLFSGLPGNLSPLACADNILLLPSTLVSGNTYYLRVYSKANAVAAGFEIGLFGEDDPLSNQCAATTCVGPNLVTNPRCESEYDYLLPKNDKGVIFLGRKIAEGWWSANYATADTWNADYPATEYGNLPGNSASVYNKVPRSGKGMLGMLYYTGWNEYITGKLAHPLQPGKDYLVSFYVSMSKETANQSCFNIGAWLNNDSIAGTDSQPLEFTPDITHAVGDIVTETDTWRNICGVFHADKAYSYITIGNFGSNGIYGGAAQTYFFVDDVMVAETSCSVLPLQLLNFRGYTNTSKQTELSWQTAHEVNTKNFEVQWSTDGIRFTHIATVNSNVYHSYQFLHTTATTGYNFYRLKINDHDGRFTYSAVVRTGMQFSLHSLQVYPNPVAATLHLRLQADKDEIIFLKMINSEGKIVVAKTLAVKKGHNSFEWSMAQLPTGNYFISSTSSGFQPVQIVKQ